MSDRRNNQEQIDKLIEMANELEKKEQQLNQQQQQLSREQHQLNSLKEELDMREKRFAAKQTERAKAAAQTAQRRAEEAQPVPQQTADPQTPQNSQPPLRYRNKTQLEKPVQEAAEAARKLEQAAPHSPVKEETEATKTEAGRENLPSVQQISPEAVHEITDILRTTFNDYSKSIHQITSQMSSVTAAMMNAAVSFVLDNHGYSGKETFRNEMQKILDKETEAATVSIEEAVPAAVPPVPTVVTPEDTDDDAWDYQEEAEEDESRWEFVEEKEEEPVVPDRTEDGVIRIATVSEFRRLGEYGFRNDDTITRVELPDGIRHLPGSFFYGCDKLEEVWLPDTLEEIGPYAFYGCQSLRVVDLGDNPSLRKIGEYAFAMNSSLEEFTIPDSIESIGTSVFRFCSALKRLAWPKNSDRLMSIGSHLLQNCTSLEKMRLPDSITTIPTSMCYGCSSLETLVARGVDTIEDYAFYGNISLRTVRVNHRDHFSDQAFEGCDPSLEIEYLQY